MHSGIILDGQGNAHDLVGLLGGGSAIGTGNIAEYAPRSGLIVDKDGAVKDIVELLGGGASLAGLPRYDMSQYAPHSGIILGADGYAYDLATLLANRPTGAPVYELVKQTAEFSQAQSPWAGYTGWAYAFTRAYIGTATRASVYVCIAAPCDIAVQILDASFRTLERRTYAAAESGWFSVDVPPSAGETFYLSFHASSGTAITALSTAHDANWAGANDIRSTSSDMPDLYSWWGSEFNEFIFPVVRFERLEAA